MKGEGGEEQANTTTATATAMTTTTTVAAAAAAAAATAAATAATATAATRLQPVERVLGAVLADGDAAGARLGIDRHAVAQHVAAAERALQPLEHRLVERLERLDELVVRDGLTHRRRDRVRDERLDDDVVHLHRDAELACEDHDLRARKRARGRLSRLDSFERGDEG